MSWICLSDVPSPSNSNVCYRRFNALYGHLLAFFVVDNMIEAIEKVASRIESGVEADVMLKELRAEEIRDSAKLLEWTKLEQEQENWIFAGHNIDPAVLNHTDEMYLSSDRPFCRTTLLPSQSRYKGLSRTWKNNQGKGVVNEDTFVWEGMLRTEADKLDKKNTTAKGWEIIQANTDRDDDHPEMVLVQDTHLHYDKCPVNYQYDFKDYYYTNERMGWTSISVPNKREKAAYQITEARTAAWKGLVLLCFMYCP